MSCRYASISYTIRQNVAAVEEISMRTMIMSMVLTAITIKYYHWHNRHSPWCKVNSDKKPNCLDFLKVLYYFFSWLVMPF